MQLNLLFYGVVSILYLFGVGKIVLNLKKVQEKGPGWGFGVIALGFIMHFWLVQSVIFPAKATLQLGVAPVISAVAFFAILMAFFGAIYANAQALLAFVLTIGSVAVWMPQLMNLPDPILYTTAQERLQWAFEIVAGALILLATGKALLACVQIGASHVAARWQLDSAWALTEDISHMVFAAGIFLTLGLLGQFVFAREMFAQEPLSLWLLAGWILSWLVWALIRFAKLSPKSAVVIFMAALVLNGIIAGMLFVG